MTPPAGSFGVHILLFDAVSSSNGQRTLPYTIDYLRREHGAFLFGYQNRVGLNSRPNAYGFMLGMSSVQNEDQTNLQDNEPKKCQNLHGVKATIAIFRPNCVKREWKTPKLSLQTFNQEAIDRCSMKIVGRLLDVCFCNLMSICRGPWRCAMAQLQGMLFVWTFAYHAMTSGLHQASSRSFLE